MLGLELRLLSRAGNWGRSRRAQLPSSSSPELQRVHWHSSSGSSAYCPSQVGSRQRPSVGARIRWWPGDTLRLSTPQLPQCLAVQAANTHLQVIYEEDE